MSNMKLASLVAHETRRVQAEDEAKRSALAEDLYAALQAERTRLREEIAEGVATVMAEAMLPLRAQLARLRHDLDHLRNSLAGDGR